MTHPNPSTALASVVMDQLAAEGVETVVISPGSRSAALAIAAVATSSLRTVVAIDERSAGFHALGVSRASGAPAAVVSTSGSAPANYFPAVVEADMSCVPLVVISADRPEEQHGVGANQTIDQSDLFGNKVRTFAGIEAPDAHTDLNAAWRGTVSALMGAATAARPGPVHLNVAFREPTVPVSDDGRTSSEPYPFPTPRLEQPFVSPVATTPLVPEFGAGRGLVIAGDGVYDRASLLETAASLGWPILGTTLSGLRASPVVTSYEHLLADGIPDELRPDTVVAIGALGPSNALDRLVSTATNRIRIDAWGRSIDPDRNATLAIPGDANDFLLAVDEAEGPEWAAAWTEADTACRVALDRVLDSIEQPTGAGLARALDRVGWEALVVASSLPIREIDAHLTRSAPVYVNRGASGIDGFVSTALGVASVHPRTLAFCGDLSLLHDANGFLIDIASDLTIVVVDNRGGGLFDSLPQAVHAPEYERLFVTDPNRDLSRLAAFHGVDFRVAHSVDEMVAAAEEALAKGGLNMISVPVDRKTDLAVRRRLRGGRAR